VCFALLLRFSGAVADEHGIVLGVLLIVLTVGMMAEVMRSLGVDVWKDIEKNKRRGDADAEAEPEASEAHAESGVEAGASTACGGGDAPDRGRAASSSAVPAAPSGSSWDLSRLMCADGSDDAKTPEDTAAENAKLHEVIARLSADLARQSEEITQLRN
jgi:hypothetical protein